jgi:FkbH-like protein
MASEGKNLDYGTLLAASRRLDLADATQKIRVALLSDAATQRFVPILRTLFCRQGVDAEIYEAPFDGIELEVYDRNSGLYQFQPQVVVLLNCVQALRASFLRPQTDTALFVTHTADRMKAVWDAVQANVPATLIQSNFVLPYERFFGNFDQKTAESFYAVVGALNARIAENARQRGSVLINDVESVASWLGRRYWFEERFWDSAKYFCALECLPYVANNIVEIVLASVGRVVKCVVVDLDNTLWGGVIGDDGLDGIQIGAHGEGEAFYRIQLYLRALRQRGIVLAACSKNELTNALLPFEKHPEMVLRRDDFAVFVANWNDKAINIKQIKETLNIGFDAMVFLDDNPFERNLVRELVPGVVVPELPEDPADYVRAISELNLFETTSFSAEDAKRTELYRAEAERREAQAGFASVEEFLQSLEMRITVARFDSFNLPRISQLMQRSNQFNLTTRRLSEIECETLMENDRWLPLYAKLADRLSDHGLISVVTLEARAEELAIRDWLMSCRVLARGVEGFLMNRVVEHAQQLRLSRITAEYIPTAKNGMVKDFFQQFGFTKVAEGPGGDARWSLSTSAYHPVRTFMTLAEGSRGS